MIRIWLSLRYEKFAQKDFLYAGGAGGGFCSVSAQAQEVAPRPAATDFPGWYADPEAIILGIRIGFTDLLGPL
jgi:hypothetical protein